MKFLLPICFLFITFCSTQAQDIYIIQNVKGKVMHNNSVIKPGDKIKSTDKLVFGKSSALLVSSQTLGRLVLQQTPATFSSETAYVLSDLLPKKKNASTRGGLCSSLEFQQYFKDSVFRVYDSPGFTTCTGSYPQDSTRFFYLQYQYKGETINKQLGHQNEITLFDTKSIFYINGMKIDHTQITFVKLFYYDPSNKRNELLAALRLESIAIDDVTKSDIQQMLLLFPSQTKCYSDIYNTVNHHLEMLFGATTHSNLAEWITLELGISKETLTGCL